MIGEEGMKMGEKDHINAGSAESILDYLGLDPGKKTIRVKSTAEAAVLRGSWHEMGVQYAMQASEPIRYLIGSQLRNAVAGLGSWEAVYKELPVYRKMVEDVFPAYLEFVDGVYEGLRKQGFSIAYEDVLNGFLSLSVPTGNADCMAVSAWGEATSDHRMYAAMHSDSSHQAVYTQPMIVAYPENGHAFISAVGFTNAYINDAGLICMGTYGFGMAEGDMAAGLPICIGILYNAAFASDAEEALKTHIGHFRVGSGEIIHYADVKGKAVILETTAGHYAVRRSGEHGEKNYLLQSNDWETEEMQTSNPVGAVMNNLYRYDTARRYIDERIGNLTMDVLREAISQLSYYDRETDSLVYEWSDDPEKRCFSPENKDTLYGCVMRRVMDAEKRTMYLLMGSQDILASKVPASTGTYAKMSLLKSPEETVAAALDEARQQVWNAARDLDKRRKNQEDIHPYMADFDAARDAVYEALNYQVLEGASVNPEEQLSLCAKSLSASMKAQCIARKLRLGDISKIE